MQQKLLHYHYVTVNPSFSVFCIEVTIRSLASSIFSHSLQVRIGCYYITKIFNYVIKHCHEGIEEMADVFGHIQVSAVLPRIIEFPVPIRYETVRAPLPGKRKHSSLRSPETETSSVYWAQLSKFHLKNGTDSSFRNGEF
jgi:hypothetical protein